MSQQSTKVPVSLPAESAPDHWLRTIQLRGFTVVVLVLIILLVIVLAPSLRILIEQRQTIAALERELADAKESVKNLTEDVARWEDPAYIVTEARDRLYWVFPGEYSYLVIDDTGAQSGSDGVPISDEIQTTQVDWVQSMLSSIYTAGLTDAAPADLEAPPLEH